MRIIPAIDVIDGKLVRLTKGDYATQKVYSENPLEQAKIFEDAGLKYLHFVDLDGAKASRPVNYKLLEKIANQTNLIVDAGGGASSTENLNIWFNSGATQVTAGSISVKDKNLVSNWLSDFGADKIILGADVNEKYIATHGWQETSNEHINNYLHFYLEKKASYFICTDIAKDGMLSGPSTALYQEILSNFSLNLIASGGVNSLADLEALKKINCEGVIIGKAIYEGKITLKQLSSFI